MLFKSSKKITKVDSSLFDFLISALKKADRTALLGTVSQALQDSIYLSFKVLISIDMAMASITSPDGGARTSNGEHGYRSGVKKNGRCTHLCFGGILEPQELDL